MPIIHHLARQFDLVYLRPSNVLRAIQEIAPRPVPVTQNQRHSARRNERRCGVERRQQRVATYLDLRCSYSRRKVSGRRYSTSDNSHETTGIDIFV